MEMSAKCSFLLPSRRNAGYFAWAPFGGKMSGDNSDDADADEVEAMLPDDYRHITHILFIFQK
jgi:hypothetical protein